MILSRFTDRIEKIIDHIQGIDIKVDYFNFCCWLCIQNGFPQILKSDLFLQIYEHDLRKRDKFIIYIDVSFKAKSSASFTLFMNVTLLALWTCCLLLGFEFNNKL